MPGGFGAGEKECRLAGFECEVVAEVIDVDGAFEDVDVFVAVEGPFKGGGAVAAPDSGSAFWILGVPGEEEVGIALFDPGAIYV